MFRVAFILYFASVATAAEPSPVILQSLEPLKYESGDSPLKILLKDRYHAALGVLNAQYQILQRGNYELSSLPLMLDYAGRAAEAHAAVIDAPAERAFVAKAIYDYVHAVERTGDQWHRSAFADRFTLVCRFYRADASLRAAECEAAAPPLALKPPATGKKLKLFEPPTADAGDTAIRKLQKSQYALALEIVKLQTEHYDNTNTDYYRAELVTLLNFHSRMLNALTSLDDDPADRFAMLNGILGLMDKLDANWAKRFPQCHLDIFPIFRYQRLDLELSMAKLVKQHPGLASGAVKPRTIDDTEALKLIGYSNFKPLAARIDDMPMDKLVRARYHEILACSARQSMILEVRNGPILSEDMLVFEYYLRTLSTLDQLSLPSNERIDILNTLLNSFKRVDRFIQIYSKAAGGMEFEINASRYCHIETEIRLLKAKAEK